MTKYVKVYDENNKIVDALSELHFVFWNPILSMVDNCSDTDDRRMGILSAHATTIWHLLGRPAFPESRGYITCQYTEIDKDEYESLRDALDRDDEDDTPVDPEPDVPDVPDPTDPDSVAVIKEAKLRSISKAENDTITSGFDVVLSDGKPHHFSLTVQDQLNLITLKEMVKSGAQEVPYHADNELCVKFSAEDITSVINTATLFKKYHETYHNSLKAYVQSLTSVADLDKVTYGMDIPEEFQSEVYKEMINELKML